MKVYTHIFRKSFVKFQSSAPVLFVRHPLFSRHSNIELSLYNKLHQSSWATNVKEGTMASKFWMRIWYSHSPFWCRHCWFIIIRYILQTDEMSEFSCTTVTSAFNDASTEKEMADAIRKVFNETHGYLSKISLLDSSSLYTKTYESLVYVPNVFVTDLFGMWSWEDHLDPMYVDYLFWDFTQNICGNVIKRMNDLYWFRWPMQPRSISMCK